MGRKLMLALAALLLNATAAAAAEEKRVVIVAGGPSHDFAAHEHAGGAKVLADTINDAYIGVSVEIVHNGWPDDPSVFDGADAIVIYADGGGGHPAMGHMEELGELMEAGVGLVCLHYAVEVPPGDPGEAFLNWLGGYFEVNWSVNPWWDANFEALPEHAITRGVQPFELRDEWYYHMRFRPEMAGVTPILTAMPPEQTLDRPRGPHSNNEHVQRAVLERGEAQHVAWAYERPDGGRGFGFTGGHVHWNWGHDDFRRLVANAIVWAAGAQVPASGVPLEPLSVPELAALTDDEPPADFEPQPIQQQLDAANGRATPLALPMRPAGGEADAEPIEPAFESDIVTADTPGHAVEIDVEIDGSRWLTLEVDDGGDGFGCDWANWIEPRLIDADGNATALTDLEWQSAESDWGQVNVNANADGGELRVDGEAFAGGIGTHANSRIVYELPEGHDFVRFVASGGLDEGGTSEGCGSTVRFRVLSGEAGQGPAMVRESRSPEHAVEQLDVAEGLELSLFASEPMISNPTNMDIDHRGRVWITDVQNYRGRQGTRPEGDRILILEDTTGDGSADKVTTFYQGSDIDSALGIAVLGNKVIVSASPNVFIFYDDDDDGKADRKEVLFSETGIAQHDHSAHAFVFGPDGRLYWNFGDTGGQVHDAEGNLIVDLAGNKVMQNGEPYRKAMTFRCDVDGSNFEVLGYNFRNPYEVTVDAFGGVWQSDNDDDGNRGVRINFILEGGNYGYTDENTGAGWNTPRISQHPAIPHRHWHSRDPGVVPNLLLTGAGSPAGIALYEGEQLPDVFHGQMIHAEPGQNVLRSYPVMNDGAGYQAKIVNLVKGTRDTWFRPVDVTAAPDGSLFVADWYDPGVGGHAMGDIDAGRIFRVAAEGRELTVPQFDFDTADGAIEALKNPNVSVRYMAWTTLHEMGAEAEAALLDLYESQNPRYQARALWLLSKINGRGIEHIERALSDDDENIRMAALRAARQHDDADVLDYVRQLVDDDSARVRREALIALRHREAEEAAALWAKLAEQHQAGDSWYLEALGIAADRQWPRFFDAYLDRVGERWDTLAGREIVWRSRAPRAADLLRQVIVSEQTSPYRRPQLVRALDFHEPEVRRRTLVALLAADQTDVVELALAQLGDVDAPEVRQAVAGVLESAQPGTFVRLVRDFDLREHAAELEQILRKDDAPRAAEDAAAVLAEWDETSRIERTLADADRDALPDLMRTLGATGDDRVLELIEQVVVDEDRPRELRSEAVGAIGRTQAGQRHLLAMVEADRLDEALHFAAAQVLHISGDAEIRRAAEQALRLPQSAEAEALPPVAELAEQRGDAARGQQVFTRLCFACHQANGMGINFGPDLSQIGDKLAREGLYVAVIDPDAGIGFDYRGVRIETDDGRALLGFIEGETADTLTLRMIGGVTTTIDRDDVAQRIEQDQSLMPANLASQMTQQELVDLVEYLTTLRSE